MDPSLFPTFSPTNHTSADGSGNQTQRDVLIIAAFSIFLYFAVAVVAINFAQKFSHFLELNPNGSESLIGKYDHVKKVFFIVLAASSLLEIPQYINCLAEDGPKDCGWVNPEGAVFWFSHIFARSGYAYCIISPCVLWSDMIYKEDGRLFFSNSPYSWIKRYFQSMLVTYMVFVFLDILTAILYYDPDDSSVYTRSPTNGIFSFLESVVIVAISIGCLACGFELQAYVSKAKIGHITEARFFRTLNMILALILVSFVCRAVMVILTYAKFVTNSYHHFVPFYVFVILARWIPDILCQSILMYIMRLSGQDILAIKRREGKLTLQLVRDDRQKNKKNRTSLIIDDENELTPEFDSAEIRNSFRENLLPVLSRISQQQVQSHRYRSIPSHGSQRTEDSNSLKFSFLQSLLSEEGVSEEDYDSSDQETLY
jgi:hypothetical protein